MRLVRRPAKRKLGRSAMLAAVSTLGALGMTAGPAAAATLSDGSGAFTATSAINPTAGGPCASYGNYQATLTFASATVGSYTGPVTFETNSTPGQYWGENNFGTFLPVVSVPTDTQCRYADPNPPSYTPPTTDAIPGFSGTLTGTNGSQTLNCTFGTGSYQRGGTRGYLTANDETGMDITYQTTGPLVNCAGETSITVKTSLTLAPTPSGTACNSPIAPQTCALDHARF